MKRKNVNEQKLRVWITERSQSDDPDRAMDEWKLAYMEYGFDRTCPCGKKHITELWYIRNVFNDKLVFVGSKCIERFMGFHPPKGWSTLEKKCSWKSRLSPNRTLLTFSHPTRLRPGKPNS